MKTERIPRLHIQARMAPESINADARTVDLIWTTGVKVRRGMFDPYDEELEVSDKAIRWDRLKSGHAPLLANHDNWTLTDQIGVIEDAWIENGVGMARVKIADVPSTAEIWAKLQQGIIRNVSVGYNVWQYEQDDTQSPPVRTATDWEPMEISLVTVPADAAAHVRGKTDDHANECVIVNRNKSGAPDDEKGIAMSKDRTKAAVRAVEDEDVRSQRMEDDVTEDEDEDEGEDGEAMDDADAERMDDEENERSKAPIKKRGRPAKRKELTVTKPDTSAAEKRARDQERARIADLTSWAEARQVPSDIRDQAIAEGWSRAKMAEEFVERKHSEMPGNQIRSNINPDFHPNAPVRISAGRQDERETRRAALENALVFRSRSRLGKSDAELSEAGREFHGMSLMECAREFLRKEGQSIRGMSNMQIASHALSRGGMHTTGDFAAILENALNKSLRMGYREAPRKFMPWTKQMTLSDFKAASMVLLSETPNLLEVNEHGEFQDGALTESKETIQLKTYGRIISITRQTLINDDLGAFTNVPSQFGLSAARLESDIVWGILLANAALLTDGTALFHADHNNLGAGVINLANIQTGRAAMFQQTGLGGSVLNLEPRYILAPPGVELAASQVVTQTTPNAAGDVTPGYMTRMEVITEARLALGANGQSGSATAWYLAAEPSQVDTIAYAYLEGSEGVFTETQDGFDVDGMRVKVRHDFAASAVDFRGLFKSTGT